MINQDWRRRLQTLSDRLGESHVPSQECEFALNKFKEAINPESGRGRDYAKEIFGKTAEERKANGGGGGLPDTQQDFTDKLVNSALDVAIIERILRDK